MVTLMDYWGSALCVIILWYCVRDWIQSFIFIDWYINRAYELGGFVSAVNGLYERVVFSVDVDKLEHGDRIIELRELSALSFSESYLNWEYSDNLYSICGLLHDIENRLLLCGLAKTNKSDCIQVYFGKLNENLSTKNTLMYECLDGFYLITPDYLIATSDDNLTEHTGENNYELQKLRYSVSVNVCLLDTVNI